MKNLQKKINELPEYISEILVNNNNTAFLEQIRVKEYSNRIEPLPGNRKALIPFSGGLDSTTSLIMAIESGIEVTTVNFNYGQEYFEKEKRVIDKIKILIEKFYPESKELWKQHYSIDISWLDDELKSKLPGEWKHIFPLRNYLILQETALLADNSHYTELWFSCVKGEIPYSGGDKSTVFLTYMSSILSPKNILLVTPHMGLEKTDIVHWANLNQQRYDIIKETISCFGGEGERQCGKCQSCFNRGVAFYANNKINDSGFDANKKDLNEFIEYYKERFNKPNYYPNSRINQIKEFILYLESK